MDSKERELTKTRSFVSRGVSKVNEQDLTVTHVITTKALDRYNTIILPKGALVKNFLKNPVALWLHNTGAEAEVKIPIAKCLKLEVSEDKIVATTKFNANEPFAVKVFNAYKDGFLHAWSIGFMPIRFTRYTNENREALNKKHSVSVKEAQIKEAGFRGLYVCDKWELLEYSAVPVPGNPEALNSPDTDVEFQKQLAIRGLIVKIDKKEPVIENKVEAEVTEPAVTPEPTVVTEAADTVKDKKDLDVTDPILTEKEDSSNIVTTEDLVGRDKPTELEKAQREDLTEAELEELDEEEEARATAKAAKKDEDVIITLKTEPKAEPKAVVKEKTIVKEEPKADVKAEPEAKATPEAEAKTESEVKTKPAVDLKTTDKEDKITKLEASISEIRQLIVALTEVTKLTTEALTKDITEIKKSLEVDNIDKLRELEESGESKTQVDVFDWAGLMNRALGSK